MVNNLTLISHKWWNCKENFLFSMDSDSYWVLYLIIDGKCKYEINNNVNIINGPAIIICPPNINFSREIITPLSFHFFRLDIFNQTDILEHNMVYTYDIPYERTSLNHKILIEYLYDLSPFGFSIREHIIKDILLISSLFLNRSVQYHEIENFHIDKRILHILKYINKYYYLDLTIEKLSYECHLNSSYFSKLFKQETGYSPKKYLLNTRLKNVQQLLIYTNLTILDISELTGFKNPYHLSKIFKKTYNMSPTNFRRTHIL